MHKQTDFDTITAVSTPPGVGAISIVRVSGHLAAFIFSSIFKPKHPQENLQTHKLVLGNIINEKGAVIDETLACFMKSPNSYTTEDVLEIHCHGGTQTVLQTLQLTIDNGARLATPGEFTKRAFVGGRIDLSQAEAVMDLINSKTELAQKASVAQLNGNLSTACKDISAELLMMIAHIEASIDYPEDDLDASNLQATKQQAFLLIDKLDKLINTANKGKIIKDGLDTAILGRPNVGKSSLLNALSGTNRAIVTDIAGTTRDVLFEYVNVSDIALKLIDTAGIRETTDTIEQMGVEKSIETAENADLALLILDGSCALTKEDFQIFDLLVGKKTIVLVNKSDLPQQIEQDKLYEHFAQENVISLSIKESKGLNELYDKIKEMFFGGEIAMNEETIVYNLRHKDALSRCRNHLQSSINAVNSGLFEDFVSIDLQLAYDAISEITGESLDSDILDKIFQTFCLGK